MKRSRINLLLRGGVLIGGLVGGWFLIIAPLWSRSAAEKSQADLLKADADRVEAGWAQLASFRTLDPGRVLSDTLLARTLADTTNITMDLQPVRSCVPEFLSEINRLGTQFDIVWSDIQAQPAEEAAVVLPDGMAITAARIRLKVSGNGGYASIGRALRAMQTGDIIVAVHDLAMSTASDGNVDAHLTIDIYGAP